MFLMMTVRTASAQADCPNEEDYSPCTCSWSTGTGGVQNYQVKCYGIDLAEVESVFGRTTTTDLDQFILYLSPIDPTKTIPADLINNHRTRIIRIYCRPVGSPFIIVDSQAFRSSQNLMTNMYLSNCDMSQLNFDFLSGFDKVLQIDFRSMLNVDQANWTSFPQLPSLSGLTIVQSTGFNKWSAFPQLARGLADLIFSINDIQDDAMNRILNWTSQYSANTLRLFLIEGNELSQIPKQLQAPHSFPNLQLLTLNDQKTGIPLITTGSLSCPSSYSNNLLEASNNRITTIDAGAFQGYFIFINLILCVEL